MTDSKLLEKWKPPSPKVAIMQPYFLPYIGYFQLMHEADVFVVYDNIKYTKKGWISRNRMLLNGKPNGFSLPLKSGSDCLDVSERKLAVDFDPQKLLRQIDGAYHRAPYFKSTFPIIQSIVSAPMRNLFDYIFNSIDVIRLHLGIATPLVASSAVDADHSLRGQNRVLAICKTLRAASYINPPGGRALYESNAFCAMNLELAFLEPRLLAYDQLGCDFVPALSILDVLMFNSIDRIREHLIPAYDLAHPDPK